MIRAAGRVLAVDLGDVRIGLAVSDPLGITTRPLAALPRVGPRKDLLALMRVVREHEVQTIVIGLPLMLDGADGERSMLSRRFAEALRAHAGPRAIELWDERMTTREAERLLIRGDVRRAKRRQVVDGIAASLILQGFLEAAAATAPDACG